MSHCPPFDPVRTRALLVEAEQAYHRLMLGGQARVIVDQNGERVEFTPTTAGRLMAYIQTLRGQLGCGTASRGPMMVLT